MKIVKREKFLNQRLLKIRDFRLDMMKYLIKKGIRFSYEKTFLFQGYLWKVYNWNGGTTQLPIVK